MLTEMRSRKERFEIALRDKEAEEVSVDPSVDILQEVNSEFTIEISTHCFILLRSAI